MAFPSDVMGYPCTIDCSGHQAGYDWARRKDIDDPAICSGNSQSFIEGCQAAAEQAASAHDDDGFNDNAEDEP